MLVKKRWITTRKEYNPEHTYKVNVRRVWEGLFLFGFIPLWVENTDTSYLSS